MSCWYPIAESVLSSPNILQLHGVYYLCKIERHNSCRIAIHTHTHTHTQFNINIKPKSIFYSVQIRVPQLLRNSRRQFQILGAREVTSSHFHTEDPQFCSAPTTALCYLAFSPLCKWTDTHFCMQGKNGNFVN